MKRGLLLLSSLFILTSTVSIKAQDYSEDIIEARKQQSDDMVELFSGDWVVGVDIPIGRYKVTIGEEQSGNFALYQNAEEQNLSLNLILDTRGIGFGVNEINLDLIGGQLIKIQSLNNVYFEPINSELTTELTSGNWLVGEDIEPGKYIAATAENTSGNLFVFDEGEYIDGFPSVNSILGNGENNIGVERIQLNLEEGQVVVISGITKMYLE